LGVLGPTQAALMRRI